MSGSRVVPVPDGTRLLHIGPHKTGTTSLQLACWASRDALAQAGVHWAGGQAHPMHAAMAASTGRSTVAADSAAVAEKWHAMVREVAQSAARVSVISSEFFSDARDERVAGILDELGRERTRVLVTLRPVARILASQWQQYMQNQIMVTYPGNPTYEGWLDAVLHHPERTDITPSFWARHRHDALVRRWAEAAGPDRVTVVVVDDSRPEGLLEDFEELVGVPRGTVRAAEAPVSNRSLTWPEVSLLRGLTQRWAEDRLGDKSDYTTFVRWRGIRQVLARPPAAGDQAIHTPQWAVERAQEIAGEMVTAIRETGVTVVGDLDALVAAAPRSVGENDPQPPVALETAAALTAGMLTSIAGLRAAPPAAHLRAGELEGLVREHKMARAALGQVPGSRERPGGGDRRRVADLSRVQLLQVVSRRIAGRIRALLARRGRRGRQGV